MTMPSFVPTLILLGTEGCHLCDDAHALLEDLRLSWQNVDVTESPELMHRYGLRIPVLLRRDLGSELCWPFRADDVLNFVRQLH